ncbi:hypothetical protein AOQ71_17130 [Bradyrhizobium manausense]|uniref:Uncharacterized protein n=1 Tax=Bradyrhizobium manausense TaxID=989370 RepID=A0A0R3DQR7_9BRAD|nr:hypothetical protein AOQ71_17130 [Bradyrhizobium manausense]
MAIADPMDPTLGKECGPFAMPIATLRLQSSYSPRPTVPFSTGRTNRLILVTILAPADIGEKLHGG